MVKLFTFLSLLTCCLLLPSMCAASNVLVLLAHPDDETWLSGSIAKLSKTHSLHIIYATSGGAGKDRTGQKRSGAILAQARELESRCAAQHLNAQVSFLQLDDKNLETFSQSLTASYLAYLTQLQPEIVISFADDGITGHKDHSFVGKIAHTSWQQWQQQNNDAKKSSFWQVVVSQPRAKIAQQIAAAANYPQPIRQPVLPSKINKTIYVSAQQHQRIQAFACYPSQFPPGLQNIWQTFVEQTPYEEFIQVNSD